MTVLPIVERELRTSARQSFTYNLRVLGLLAVLLAGVVFGSNYGFQQNLGPKLFGALHATLFCAIWIFVPFLAGDSISRERREGTLGLLFMTPLRAPDIVIAKGLAHGLRALTLWLAVLPVLTLPFIMGGIGWSEAVMSVLINSSAICLALAAGLAASALSRVWTRVLVYAGSLSFAFSLAFMVFNMFFVLLLLRRVSIVFFSDPQRVVIESFVLATAGDGGWPRISADSPRLASRAPASRRPTRSSSWPWYSSSLPAGSTASGARSRPRRASNGWKGNFASPSSSSRSTAAGCGGSSTGIPSAGSNNEPGPDAW
jgi:ABC-type transport system involved in multi-copper enzyme maturation permease subunit